ncbi:DNA-directed DNA polymerase, partial [Tanacetum coccineum]
MENEHELSYETLTRVYLGSYEHYKGVVAEVEHSKPGFELQGAKMVETGRLRFLNFFNDPRIIREQRIAAYKGYRGGDVGGLGDSLNVLDGVVWCRGCCGRKRGDVASFETKRRSKLLVTKGAGQIWARHGFQESFQGTDNQEKDEKQSQNDKTGLGMERTVKDKAKSKPERKVGIDKALADLEASISLMPYSMYARLDLGELKLTRMCIELANKSTQYPRGIAENVIIKINKFIFPVDFVVLDMKEDHKITIILGRPFLATAHAMIDVFNKKISFEVGNETITFDIKKSMKFSTPEDDECLFVDLIDNVVSDLVKEILPSSTLDSFLFEPILNFQQNIIISSLLNSQEKESLLKILTQHKVALAWKVADIKGISPSFCTHKILMEENFKPVVQPQRKLNPKVQDVVKAEIVKLLDNRLIYAISDSPW